jgi:hypothetical protein
VDHGPRLFLVEAVQAAERWLIIDARLGTIVFALQVLAVAERP